LPRAASDIVAVDMRTLVISDLHLGSRLGRDVLRRSPALEVLLEALADVDRLVLLGDVLELTEVRAAQAAAVAEPVLRALSDRVAEVVIVPGNHDRALVRPWLRTHGVPAAVDAPIPLDATPLLAEVAAWLSPASVRVHYPGVWLSPRVWATHGHYLDRHLLPESAYGVARGLLGRLPAPGAVPADYEQRGRPAVPGGDGPLGRWLSAPLVWLLDVALDLVRAASMPVSPRSVIGRRLAALAPLLLGLQMRRAALPALGHVVRRLGIDADWVIFGHVHRGGPLPGDDIGRWTGPEGRPRLANTGSWVYETPLLHRVRAPHPYWPGGGVVLDDDGDPRAVGLLDHLPAAVLHPGRH
jgi:UDP-2,3-diacylglucosamine pyrophosphatase LpxH